MMDIGKMGAAELAQAIRDGRLSSVQVVKHFLDRIEEQEPSLQAWAFLNPEYALSQAEAADRGQAGGKDLGPLHGVPVGVKDIFDTRDMPTENGTVVHQGRQPDEDSFAVSLLRGAGAVIMGKTVTAECAYYTPGKTTNPHDHSRTPGGSSSGSAAAVAAGMVPLALGTQTNGSVIRPASFCGVVGFKPTHGRISKTGVLHLSRFLDQVGVFSNTIGDAALAADVLMAYDPRDPDMRPHPAPNLANKVKTNGPLSRVGLVKSPVWDQAEEETKKAFLSLGSRLNLPVEPVDLPPEFDQAVRMHTIIMESDFGLSFKSLYEHSADRLSPVLRASIERGQEVRAVDYNRSLQTVPGLIKGLNRLFDEYDLLLTPAAPGPAPMGLETTGNPIFCTLWTLCGVPAVSLPLLKSDSELPLGVQAVGKRGEDGKLLASAARLLSLLQT